MAVNTPYYLSNKGKSQWHKNKAVKAGSGGLAAGAYGAVLHSKPEKAAEFFGGEAKDAKHYKTLGKVSMAAGAVQGVRAGHHALQAHKYNKAAEMVAAHRRTSHGGRSV